MARLNLSIQVALDVPGDAQPVDLGQALADRSPDIATTAIGQLTGAVAVMLTPVIDKLTDDVLNVELVVHGMTIHDKDYNEDTAAACMFISMPKTSPH